MARLDMAAPRSDRLWLIQSRLKSRLRQRLAGRSVPATAVPGTVVSVTVGTCPSSGAVRVGSVARPMPATRSRRRGAVVEPLGRRVVVGEEPPPPSAAARAWSSRRLNTSAPPVRTTPSARTLPGAADIAGPRAVRAGPETERTAKRGPPDSEAGRNRGLISM